jgi:hypothetical protein
MGKPLIFEKRGRNRQIFVFFLHIFSEFSFFSLNLQYNLHLCIPKHDQNMKMKIHLNMFNVIRATLKTDTPSNKIVDTAERKKEFFF